MRNEMPIGPSTRCRYLLRMRSVFSFCSGLLDKNGMGVMKNCLVSTFRVVLGEVVLERDHFSLKSQHKVKLYWSTLLSLHRLSCDQRHPLFSEISTSAKYGNSIRSELENCNPISM
jgi:hypothetical protein